MLHLPARCRSLRLRAIPILGMMRHGGCIRLFRGGLVNVHLLARGYQLGLAPLRLNLDQSGTHAGLARPHPTDPDY